MTALSMILREPPASLQYSRGVTPDEIGLGMDFPNRQIPLRLGLYCGWW